MSPEGLAPPDSKVAAAASPAWLVPAAFAVALIFRLVALGGSSMWLDEIMETLMAGGSLRRLISALVFDRAQPPLEPLLTWVLLHVGAGETARRVVSALFLSGAIALFARWVCRRFGVRTAAATALFLATSPALLRYSHELRPYALSLLLAAWALDAADRWIERGAERLPWELLAALTAASLTHYFALAVALPVAAAWFEGRVDGSARRALDLRLAGAAALVPLPLVLWFGLLAARGGPQQPTLLPQWSYAAIEQRFEDLLLRGYAGQPIVPHATLLFAVFAVAGFMLVARRRGGLTLLAGVVAGTLPVELALLAAGRFTHFRYNLLSLFFLYAAMAVAIAAFAAILARWNRLSGRAAGMLLAGAVVATSATGVVGYAQHGRPDWPAVARAAVAIDGADARVVATIPWAQISLGYYLGRYTDWPQEPAGVPVIYNERERLQSEIAGATGCRLVLVAGFPRAAHLFDGLRPKPPLLELPDTDAAALYRFAVGGSAKSDCFAPPGFKVEPSPGYGRLFPWLHGGR